MVLDTKIATRQSYGEALAKLGEENKDIVRSEEHTSELQSQR